MTNFNQNMNYYYCGHQNKTTYLIFNTILQEIGMNQTAVIL